MRLAAWASALESRPALARKANKAVGASLAFGAKVRVVVNGADAKVIQQANLDLIRFKRRIRRLKNLEHYRKAWNEYRAKNIERVRAVQRRYRDRNREKLNAYYREYRRQRRGAQSS